MALCDGTSGCGAQVLLRVIQPYTRISIAFIATELNISPPEVTTSPPLTHTSYRATQPPSPPT